MRSKLTKNLSTRPRLLAAASSQREALKRILAMLNQLHYRIVTRLRTWAPDVYEEQREHPVLGVMGEGGQRNDSIRLVSYRKHSVNLIALWQKFGSEAFYPMFNNVD
ncbi:hypothetical protein HO173_012816 [Letharia columbiana]|uniref:Uncharacterized protein n=1 Tax=Letharia columbiana TaxID=112416 RepID=A0A8H6CLJ1_9LECA|nr:uncharacterized protein HO173_012816 [Letharia columbiana]KAF6225331.1 hypothetical protein HO173_012816 [Letharia columbiana]